jgi:hypothetical protein
MAEEKRYCRGSGKQWTFQDSGNSILNLSIHPGQLAELLVQVNKERVAQGVKESEFLTIQVAEKQTPGEWGDTHYAYVRPYKKYEGKGGTSTPKNATRDKKKTTKKGENEMPWDTEE